MKTSSANEDCSTSDSFGLVLTCRELRQREFYVRLHLLRPCGHAARAVAAAVLIWATGQASVALCTGETHSGGSSGQKRDFFFVCTFFSCRHEVCCMASVVVVSAIFPFLALARIRCTRPLACSPLSKVVSTYDYIRHVSVVAAVASGRALVAWDAQRFRLASAGPLHLLAYLSAQVGSYSLPLPDTGWP